MKNSEKTSKNKTVLRPFREVSFSPDQLSIKRTVSKERALYIKNVSDKALSALTV
jgi:hypothetical protein